MQPTSALAVVILAANAPLPDTRGAAKDVTHEKEQ